MLTLRALLAGDYQLAATSIDLNLEFLGGSAQLDADRVATGRGVDSVVKRKG